MQVILDWDGTATVDDTLIVALREFGDWRVYLDAAAALQRGEITLHEEIRRDAESNQFVDMIQAGIIDPTKVERVALQNAASIASLLLTTEALITSLPDDGKNAMPSMPHGGDDY